VSIQIGGTGSDSAAGIAADSLGNVFTTGYFQETVVIEEDVITSNGARDIFVTKLDSEANPLWSSGFGNSSDDWPFSIDVDAAGNAVATGLHQGTVDFGGGAISSGGLEYDVFVVKLASDGSHVWSISAGGSGNDIGRGIAADVSSNVLFTGSFGEIACFGGASLTSAGNDDVFLIKYAQ
jgi:hypothetical protein